MRTNDTHQILRLARLFAKAKGHRLSTVSLRIANHGALFGRLDGGDADLTTRRRDRIFQKLSDHWPTDLPWPDDIPRPAPTPGSPAALAAGEATAPEDAA